MEFGKRGDAKKAMKLKWKKGISLKQAWKEIKGGKKYSSKRKTKTSPKRKRVQNNAKKAMRMHHREGISLKQAWKRVLNTKSRFGARGLTWDSDCPSGYESNPSIFGNPCLKKCGPYQERNPKTNKCVGRAPRRVEKPNKTPPPVPTKTSSNKKTGEIPFEKTSMNILPEDVQNLIKKQTAAMTIQDAAAKKMNTKNSLYEALKLRGLQNMRKSHRHHPVENIVYTLYLWRNLDPDEDFGRQWLIRASKVLTKNDFDFKTRNFWWKIIEYQLKYMEEIEDWGGYLSLNSEELRNYTESREAIKTILNKVGYFTPGVGIDWAGQALRWWRNKNRPNLFGK